MRDREKAKKQTAVTAVLRLDVANAQVWQGEQLLTLTPKAFAVLHYFSEHAGRLVTKDELMQTVWADTVVTDGALAASIRELRKALQDDAQSPQYIETVHRRGYRFIGKVVSDQLSVVIPPPSSPPRSQLIPDPRPPIPTLVGREAELAQLHQWLAKALHGARQLIFVTGEPGIGKTTLVDAFLAESRDWRLEAGSASPQVSSLKSQAPSF
jgi:DNA-binding winged helix-turn-helix (wHTH) protein